MPPFAFVDQPQGKIQGKADKKRVRQHAMNHSVISRSGGRQTKKKGQLVELEIPEGFGESGVGDLRGDDGEDVQIDETGDLEAATGRMMNVVVGLERQSESQMRSQGCAGFVAGGAQLVFDAGPQMSGGLPLLAPRQSSTSSESSRTISRRSRGRVFAPKVKTGCKACKYVSFFFASTRSSLILHRTRRVKCDEDKPECLRCLQYYGSCSGYLTPPQSETTATLRPLARRPSPSVERPFTVLEFEDDTSSLYFRVYQEETSPELNGVFASSFWSQIILQESHRHEFVLKAICAIGALNKATKADHWAVLLPENSEMLRAEAITHRESALKMYGSALRHMRALAATSQHDLRRIVISSLLVYAFETFHGSPDVAFSHSLIGDRLICNWLLKLGTHSGVNSPAPSVLEDEILRAMVRVDLTMMTFTDVRGRQTHMRGKIDGQPGIDTMPLLFERHYDAMRYLELLMRRSCHFAYLSFTTSQSKRLQREFQTSTPLRGVEMVSGNTIYSSPYIVTPALIAESQSYLHELQRFEDVFNPLYNSVLASGTKDDEICVKCLRMWLLTTRIMIAGTVFAEESQYDDFLPEFEELLELGRYLTGTCLDYRRGEPKFGLDLGVVSPFFMVGLRCRERRVRREVFGVLLSNPNREGPWVSFLLHPSPNE
jgi:hypothetical protein